MKSFRLRAAAVLLIGFMGLAAACGGSSSNSDSTTTTQSSGSGGDSNNLGGALDSLTGDCAKAWPPVLAAKDAKAFGDWTLIKREDGTNQWAYRGKPVYTLYHDTPDGVGETGPWHLLPYER